MEFYVAVILILVCLWTIFDNWFRKVQNRPPGPFKLPLIGDILYMLPAVINPSKLNAMFKFDDSFAEKYLTYKPAYIILDELSRKYGPLTSLQFGNNSAVIVACSKLAREILCREEFADRFADGWFLERQFGKPLGLIFNNGENYKKLKYFTVKHLKNFGLGRKENMEIAVEDELVNFLENFEKKVEKQGNIVLIHHTFTLPVLNILWEMVAGIRFSYDDEKLHRLITIVEEVSKSHDLGGNILMAFPWLRFIFPTLTGHNYQMRLYDELKQFFSDLLTERMSEHYANNLDSPRDFVDVFVSEIKRQSELPEDERSSWMNVEQFIIVCLDLFTAGSETTANTLEFAIQFILQNPSVQRKVQQEIDDVIGRNRLPNMSDRQRMPYTIATLLETQRLCNVIPLVHRVTKKDAVIGGYSIKKDEVMVLNMHSIHMHENAWRDPSAFDPGRFLDDNGSLKNLETFLPFGMGKRICMGEHLAKHTLFTYFTAILQKYDFQIPSGKGISKPRQAKGFTLSPDPFKAFVTPR